MNPSPTIARWAALVPENGPILDVAAGNGRHSLLFAELGHPVVAVDRDVTALQALGDDRIEIIESDLENGPWPLPDRTFAGVVVSNYLWRPLLPILIASVAPGGALLYETFAVGNERYGRPRNPDFLLREGELLEAVAGHLEVHDYGHGPEGSPPTAMRQRLCGIRPQPA